MKGWIEVEDVRTPITGIELSAGHIQFRGLLKGPILRPLNERPVVLGHDGLKIYRCSTPVYIPRLRHNEDCALTVDVTLHELGATPGATPDSGYGPTVFT